MKKVAILLGIILSINSAFAYEYNKDLTDNIIKDEQQVQFCTDNQTWSLDCNSNAENFTKRITYGSGGFSIYEKEKKLYDTDTTLEFLYNNKLLGYNTHKLKFYTLQFDNDKFEPKELSDEEIKAIFPDVEIVKVSQFDENNTITIKGGANTDKTIAIEYTITIYKNPRIHTQ